MELLIFMMLRGRKFGETIKDRFTQGLTTEVVSINLQEQLRNYVTRNDDFLSKSEVLAAMRKSLQMEHYCEHGTSYLLIQVSKCDLRLILTIQ